MNFTILDGIPVLLVMGDSTKPSRRYLIAPALATGNIYVFDTAQERTPTLFKVISGELIKEKFGLTWPHTSHCLPTGEIMVSYMGDKNEGAKGGFLLFDATTFEPKALWSSELLNFGYDFWYQPRHNIMVSSEFGSPHCFKKGFNPNEVPSDYGKSLYFWNWTERKLIQKTDLGNEGMIPLEVRFLHNPTKPHGFVGAALSSSIIHFYREDASGDWKHQKVIQVDARDVTGWILPSVPGLITDILISLDDRYLFFSNWLQGDVRQYDITDPFHPILVGQIFIGGVIKGQVKPVFGEAPILGKVKGTEIRGGPQMLQLSLDGKRLYVTTSLLSSWDDQFYPDMRKEGGCLILIDVDNERGGLKFNENFLVDFSKEPWGPVVGHEVRYPGGDCSSDIWI